MAASPSRVATRYLVSSWYDEFAYDGLMDGIPQERYGEYDALVHHGYSEAMQRLDAYLTGRGHRTPGDIQKEYEEALLNASRIPGTKRALTYARKHGLGKVVSIVNLLNKAEALRAEAQKQINAAG